MRDPFRLLGVQPSAGPRAVRAAFRARAFRLHPDRNPGDPVAAERFRQLVWAYRAALGTLAGPSTPVSPPVDERPAQEPPPGRRICPACRDRFEIEGACARCDVPLVDATHGSPATPPPTHPRVEALIAKLERPRGEPFFEPGPDLPFAAALGFAVLAYEAARVGLVPLGLMLVGFGALVAGLELHARRLPRWLRDAP